MKQNQITSDESIREEEKLFSKTLLSIFNGLWKSPWLLLCIIILLVSLWFCFLEAPTIGKTVGTAIGSWKGITQGISEGRKAGKAAGISAEDTKVKIKNRMTDTGKLQVLMVDLKLTDLYQQDDKYAALYSMNGEGVFSVDLTQTEVNYSKEKNLITITIPEPVFVPYLDDSTAEIIAEYKAPLFDGSTADGYKGYIYSAEQIDKKIQEEMQTMLEQAKNSAKDQVELLAKSVCGSTATVKVIFAERED